MAAPMIPARIAATPVCPPPSEWDRDFQTWLFRRYMTRILAHDGTMATAWVRVLEATFHGEWIGTGRDRWMCSRGAGRPIVWAAAQEEYARALREAAP